MRPSWVMSLALLGALLIAGSAAAAAPPTRVVTMDGYAAPGTPPQLNKVRVIQIGKRSARHVLVLVPGTSGGGTYFAPVARDIVRRLPRWQVWAIERRENLLEDQSVLRRAKAGQVNPQGLFDYYLGWISDPAITTHFVPKSDAVSTSRWNEPSRELCLRFQRLRRRTSGLRLPPSAVLRCAM